MNSRIMNLKDCVLLIIDCRGKTPKKLRSDWVAEGIRVISANNVHDGVLTDENEIRCVDDITYDKWMKEPVQRGDCFLVSEGATLGESLYWDSDEKIALGQRLYAIRTKKDILDSKYFSLYLRSNICRKAISAISTGSTVFGISQKDLLELEIVVPDIYIQKEIGQLKYEIDKKIQNNNGINLELESMAKTIYDYWFLQFDFPDENGKPYKSSGGKMVWNEELKREIPEGWEVIKLERLCSFSNGINYEKNKEGDKVYKIINVRNITATSLLLDAGNFDEINLLSFQAEKYIVEPYDILIARSGTPGAIRLLYSSDENVIYCGFIIRCSPNEKKQRLFLTYALKKLEGSNATKTGGSIMQNVSQETLKQIDICLPSEKLIDRYNDMIMPLINRMQEIIWENHELISLRDFLLPLLMNGQVGFR